jgi:glycine hydroxymethyltransferase
MPSWRICKGRWARVEDLGTHDGASVDYPDFAELVSERVLDGRADAGILVCTTGIGMSIAANRHAGIQASTGA